MGQKVNPLGFRLGITKKHRSQWFVKDRKYSQLAVEDFFLRKSILSTFFDAGIIDIKIQRKLDQIQLEMQAARPGIIIGPDGSKLEQVRQELETKLKKFRKKNFYFYRQTNQSEGFEKVQIALHIKKLSNPYMEATFVADFMVEQIQKRIPFRRAMKQALLRVQRESIKGIKIQISGRLNGAEIARSEWIREGRVPLQTVRAKIDYSYQIAKTIYGIIGIKVWIFQGEN